MKPVLAFLTLADFLKLFGGKLHFSKRRGNETPNEIEVNLDLLRGLNAALAVTLMHQDFLDKLIEHGNRQRVKVLVLVNQSDKSVCVLFLLLVTADCLFQSRDFSGQLRLLFCILSVQSDSGCLKVSPECCPHRFYRAGLPIRTLSALRRQGVCAVS